MSLSIEEPTTLQVNEKIKKISQYPNLKLSKRIFQKNCPLKTSFFKKTSQYGN
jgi:hypothetical protein